MLNKIKSFILMQRFLYKNIQDLRNFHFNDLKSPKINLGQIQARFNAQKQNITSLHEVEFQVFSQWGDDGIIQYLVDKINIPNKTFIEFGVETYRESNTRFLLINNKWNGLVIDGSKDNIDFIKKDTISWAYNLHTIQAFITKENINDLIRSFLDKGFSSEIGLLSIDIDGNDYWILQEINVVNPVIIVAEYNAAFGPEKPWTIPYKEDFYRIKEDETLQYWGVSLKALCLLAEQKGYHFIGCNSNGNNAYFVRKDKIGNLAPVTSEQGFVDSTFREYADENGERPWGPYKLNLIKGKKIFNIETNQLEII